MGAAVLGILITAAFMIRDQMKYRHMSDEEKIAHDFRKELDLWDSALFVKEADIKEDA